MIDATPSASALDEIEAALAVADARPAKPSIQKVRYSHDAMIDLIVMNPAISQGELAEVFGYTQGWVSIVINSDAFQARLEQRKAELIDPTIRVTLKERFTAVVARSLEVLQEKLAQDPSKVPDNLALRAAEMGAKALGQGGHAPPPPAPLDHLNTLAGRLLALQGRSSPDALEFVYDEKSYQAGADAGQPDSPGPSDPSGETGPEGGGPPDVCEPSPTSGVDSGVGGEPRRLDPDPEVTDHAPRG